MALGGGSLGETIQPAQLRRRSNSDSSSGFPDVRRQGSTRSDSSVGTIDVSSALLNVVSNQPGCAPRRPKRSPFWDLTAARRRLLESINRRSISDSSAYQDHGIAQVVARSPTLEKVYLLVNLLCFLWVSIELDLEEAPTLLDAHLVVIIVEVLFGSFFIIHWLIRVCAFRQSGGLTSDLSFVFDSFMLIILILESSALLALWLLSRGLQEEQSVASTVLLPLIHILRLSRMLRILRVICAIRDCAVLLKLCAAVARSVAFAMIPFVTVLFFFAVVFRHATVGTDVGRRYFATVPGALQTLLLEGVAGGDTGGFVDLLMESLGLPAAVCLLLAFYAFLLLSVALVLNSMVGLASDAVSRAARYEHEERDILELHDELVEAIFTLTTSRFSTRSAEDFWIGKETFRQLLQLPRVIVLLQRRGVDIQSVMGLADDLFVTQHGQERALRLGEVLEVLLQHRRSSAVVEKDVAALQRHLQHRIKRVQDSSLGAVGQLNSAVHALSHEVEKVANVDFGTIERLAAETGKRQEEEEILSRSRRSSRLMARASLARASSNSCLVEILRTALTHDGDVVGSVAKPSVLGRSTDDIVQSE